MTITLLGELYLSGNLDTNPGESWWACWYAYVEVYDPITLEELGSDYDFYRAFWPGEKAGARSVTLGFDIDIPYDTDYALRFSLDLETHAEVPEPTTLGLLLAGSLLALRRRRGPQR